MLFGWLRLIIIVMFLLSIVENETVSEKIRHNSISLSTFMNCLPHFIKLVEERISSDLPDLFALVFDGWTCGYSHYLAIYASFGSEIDAGFQTRLLTFSRMGDEDSLDASSHLEFIVYILGL